MSLILLVSLARWERSLQPGYAGAFCPCFWSYLDTGVHLSPSIQSPQKIIHPGLHSNSSYMCKKGQHSLPPTSIALSNMLPLLPLKAASQPIPQQLPRNSRRSYQANGQKQEHSASKLKGVEDKKTNTPPLPSCPGDRAGAGFSARAGKRPCTGSEGNASSKAPCAGLRC